MSKSQGTASRKKEDAIASQKMPRSPLLRCVPTALLLALLATGSVVRAFVAPTLPRRAPPGARGVVVVAPPPSSSLRRLTRREEKRNDVPNADRGSDEVNAAIYGIDRGAYLLAFAFLVNVWFFSVPVEFRRTKICTAEQTRDFPDVCMTPEQFKSGIAEYYRNGEGRRSIGHFEYMPLPSTIP